MFKNNMNIEELNVILSDCEVLDTVSCQSSFYFICRHKASCEMFYIKIHKYSNMIAYGIMEHEELEELLKYHRIPKQKYLTSELKMKVEVIKR